MSTSHALDRLDRPTINSEQVGQALATWQHVAHLPRDVLSGPHNDWTDFIGPTARAQLEQALHALSQRQAASLRTLVERADETLRAKTLNNPTAEPSQPWWAKRW
jgi:hypothetical protein